MRASHGPGRRRKSLSGKPLRSNLVSFEPLEPRLLLSAATDLGAEFFKTDPPLGGVVERSVDTEHLFDPADAESDAVLILGASSGTPVGEDGVWWNWSGSLAIPDGPGGAWVGINCLQPGAIPSNNAVTRVALHHEITHTWIGDLEVLVFNNNHTWVVRDNEGGSDDDINETRNQYTLFDGDNPVQDWYYRVRDTQYIDTGTLDVMQLYVYYDVRVNTAPVIADVPDVAIDEDTTFPVTEESTDDVLGFDADTSVFLALDDGGTPLGDATPTGTSYLLTDFHGGTWSDTEKSPTNTEDDLMCWAAAASNVLEWTGWGETGGMTTSDQMFAYFQNHWT
ncbi:MAG TPA: proprotein convertase P-domain-containing protein, partial [Planctomycetota bacterium]|nr:proprotein convertase P-domain-containing protein [Planctomycetota bacterium]